MKLKTCDSQYQALIFPFMAKGHTIPLLRLAHLLIDRGIFVTVFTTPANHPFVANFLLGTNANVISLPFPQDIQDIPCGIESTDKLPSISFFPQFALATILMQPEFERELERLPGANFIVSDGFLWWTVESAAKFGIPRLVFYGMSNYAFCVSKCVAENRLLFGPESDDELITLPEFPWIKITRNDFESPFRDGDLEQQKTPHSEFVLNCLIASSVSYGFVTNSFYELEPVFADHSNRHIKPKSWCIGPLCLAKTPTLAQNEKPSWIKWLDDKLIEGKPVLYVAFGSQAEISTNQLREIAIGLEESMVNFLWVTRKTGDLEKFEESVKGRGLIVKEWVDQMEILMHRSVEGFLSHCGWNSTIESVFAGVPILAWPMMAEQPLNARMVVEEIKVGLRVETCEGSVKGFVKSEGLKKMAKALMEEERGDEVRDNVKKYSEMAKNAMEEGFGSSWKCLDLLIHEICSGKRNINAGKV